jgi:hypothetical protein
VSAIKKYFKSLVDKSLKITTDRQVSRLSVFYYLQVIESKFTFNTLPRVNLLDYNNRKPHKNLLISIYQPGYQRLQKK